jgi:heme exporter protein B
LWRDARLVAGKDLRIELASRVGLNQVVPFALAVLLVLGLALGPDPKQLRPAAAGLFWVAVLFSAVLAVQRSFAIESADDGADGLRLSGLDPAGIFFGKAGAIALQLLALEVVLALAAAVLYGVALSGAAVLVAAALCGTAALAALGVVYGAVAFESSARTTLLPLLFLPLAAPVLLAATNAWRDAFDGHPAQASGWLELLVCVAVAFGALGAVCFGSLLEDR